MGDAGQGGPVRLAILLVSIAGLIGLGVQTARGPDGASASHGSSAGHGVPGKIIAVVSRRRVPVVVRREVIAPRASGAAAIRVAGSIYLLGGTRRSAPGSRVSFAASPAPHTAESPSSRRRSPERRRRRLATGSMRSGGAWQTAMPPTRSRNTTSQPSTPWSPPGCRSRSRAPARSPWMGSYTCSAGSGTVYRVPRSSGSTRGAMPPPGWAVYRFRRPGEWPVPFEPAVAIWCGRAFPERRPSTS